MQLDNLSLAYLVEELKPIVENSFINKVQEIKKNIFKLKLRTKQGAKSMIIASNAVFLSDYKLDAKPFAAGYSAYLKKRIQGKKILGLKQYLLERIIVFELEEYNLLIELFGEGNIVLLDKENSIQMPLHREKWKDRIIKKNVPYEFPPARHSILGTDEKEFVEFVGEKDEKLFKLVFKELNVAPIYVEETFLVLNMDLEANSNAIKENDLKKLFKKLKEIYTVNSTKKAPYITKHRNKQALLPIKLNSFPKVKEFSSLSEALDEIHSTTIILADDEKQLETQSKALKKIEKNLGEQNCLLEKFEKEEKESKRKGEYIYENFQMLDTLIKGVQKAIQEGKTKEELMYKIELGEKAGLIPKKLIKNIDLKSKKLILEIK